MLVSARDETDALAALEAEFALEDEPLLMGDQGLGHIVLHTRDVEATKRFYMTGLGFRLSDMIDMQMVPGASRAYVPSLQSAPPHPSAGSRIDAEAPQSFHAAGQ